MHAIELIEKKVDLKKEDFISWSSYHASCQEILEHPESMIATLPIFLEKADSPAMVRHAMLLQIQCTSFLNPGQVQDKN